ncbi:MAG: c-type cytochrome [Pseudomonadota bacterium]|nr:c-type cytochrome [Pseudomonadota bacterium]
MQDHKNTIAGWVLFAGIIALGASIVSGEMFHGERPEKMGYPIEGVELEGEGGDEAEQPIAFFLATADVARGEQVFKKCAACHNADPGGANALGPALHGVMGADIAAKPGFAYSDALKGVAGAWGWDNMSAWLANPRKFVAQNKMTFAGLGNPQERADVMLFLNSRGGTLTVPPPPADDPAATANEAEAAENEIGGGAERAPDQPVLNSAEAAPGGQKNVGGDAAPVSQ